MGILKRYFFPHVSDKETGAERKLNFYLIPVDGAKLYIDNSDGSITIENENQVYRAISVQDIPEPEPRIFLDVKRTELFLLNHAKQEI